MLRTKKPSVTYKEYRAANKHKKSQELSGRLSTQIHLIMYLLTEHNTVFHAQIFQPSTVIFVQLQVDK